MKLTPEQRGRISLAMIDATADHLQMLAAGMRELAKLDYYSSGWHADDEITTSDVLGMVADDLEAK